MPIVRSNYNNIADKFRVHDISYKNEHLKFSKNVKSKYIELVFIHSMLIFFPTKSSEPSLRMR